MSNIKKFIRDDVDVQADDIGYAGFFSLRIMKLRHRLFEGGWSKTLTRELLTRDQAVAVLLYDPDLDKVALIEQFRVGALQGDHSPWLLELVAGLIDKDETPEQVIHREAMEEAGVTINALVPITEYYSSPGGSNEYIYVYCGKADLSQAGGVFGLEEEGEDIKVHVLTFDECWEKLIVGEFRNAHTTIAVQWLKINRESLIKQWC